MHLLNGSRCSRVRWRRWTRLRRHTDHPSSRRNILEGEEGTRNKEKLVNWVNNIFKKKESCCLMSCKLTGLEAPPGPGAPAAA